MARYKIIRFFQDPDRIGQVIVDGLSEDVAKAWCASPEADSKTATGQEAEDRTALYGPWFDGYALMDRGRQRQ